MNFHAHAPLLPRSPPTIGVVLPKPVAKSSRLQEAVHLETLLSTTPGNACQPITRQAKRHVTGVRGGADHKRRRGGGGDKASL